MHWTCMNMNMSEGLTTSCMLPSIKCLPGKWTQDSSNQWQFLPCCCGLCISFSVSVTPSEVFFHCTCRTTCSFCEYTYSWCPAGPGTWWSLWVEPSPPADEGTPQVQDQLIHCCTFPPHYSGLPCSTSPPLSAGNSTVERTEIVAMRRQDTSVRVTMLTF